MSISQDDKGDDAGVDIVSTIINGSPFRTRCSEEKLEILKKGRPLPNLTLIKRDNGRGGHRPFQPSWYTIHKWLCASLSCNKLFCWPCILMRPETSSWSSTGNKDTKKFTALATKHAISKSHLKAILEYDATLAKYGLVPEFISGEKKSSDDDDSSNLSDAELVQCTNDSTSQTNIKTVISKGVSPIESMTNLFEENSSTKNDNTKVRTKITFKTQCDSEHNLQGVSKPKFIDDHTLHKWKRKVAKQELKNAQLAGEKLQFEIEVLKAKAEYYKSLKA